MEAFCQSCGALIRPWRLLELMADILVDGLAADSDTKQGNSTIQPAAGLISMSQL